MPNYELYGFIWSGYTESFQLGFAPRTKLLNISINIYNQNINTKWNSTFAGKDNLKLYKSVTIAGKLPNKINTLIPSDLILRKMGLVTDQEGIFRRYLNEGNSWREHLENTKKFICGTLEESKHKSISVFGSGWMLDIPTDFLLSKFQKVVFYDIRHPKKIRQRYANYPNAHFINMDLTGGFIEQAYQTASRRGRNSLTEISKEFKAQKISLPVTTDYYLSVNLLNQLDILIVDYLKKKVKLDEEDILEIRKTIQENHLRLLPKGISCIITDYEEVHLDNSGNEIETEQLLYCKLPKGTYETTWTWKFDTLKNYHVKWRTNLKVKAIRF